MSKRYETSPSLLINSIHCKLLNRQDFFIAHSSYGRMKESEMFNVTKCIVELEESGFTQEQARVSLAQWIKLMDDNLTTKVEMKELEFALRTDMKELHSDLNKLEYRVGNMEVQLKELKFEMREGFAGIYSLMKWAIGLGVPTVISLFAGLYFKLFFG